MSDELKTFTDIKESHSFVMKKTAKINTMLLEAVEGINEEQRWSLCARIINSVFSQFYGPTVKTAEQIVENENIKAKSK